MKAKTRTILLVSGGAVLLAAIVAANLARGGGAKTAVQAADVKRGKIASTVRAPGRIQPVTQVKLSANVPGEVVRLAVKEGDVVRKGQFLLQLDDTQVRSRMRESEAALEASRSNLRLAEASLAQSDASLQRKEALFVRKLVSPEEVEAARTQRNADKARVDANREDISRAMATLAGARDNLRKTSFYAPIPGTVTQLAIERGEIVVTGTMNNPGTVILTIADMSAMKVEADVDETDVSSVALAQPVTVKVDAFPDLTLHGSVVEIANSPKISESGTQEQQTNFEVDVAIQNPPASLRPGMTADVEIRTAEKDGVLTVPIQSVVVRTPEELKPAVKGRRPKTKGAAAATAPADSAGKPGEEIKGVFVIVNGTAQFRKVTPGITSDTDMEVAGDVKPGEKVITGPFRVLRNLKPEARVKIEEPKRPQEKK
ncbi:MAG TPA: efflux RND transporter periplasmic adaptor subunit [Candidatus Omnitrophota bacterium]|nr:efflux RND transporter periplasmic adaptor subunit [Candidatus Omnitrophota bacterium]